MKWSASLPSTYSGNPTPNAADNVNLRERINSSKMFFLFGLFAKDVMSGDQWTIL